MSTFTFRFANGHVEDIEMTIAERDRFLLENPGSEQLIVAATPTLAPGLERYKKNLPTDFRNKLSYIKKANKNSTIND